MQYTLTTLALAALAAAAPAPQGVTSAISPQSSSPPGCQASYSGSFEIETVNVTSSSKRSLAERQSSALTLSLSNGILKDSAGRTGYIAGDNSQLQFDNPPQTGAEYTAGWSVCGNGTLALGGYTVFQQCFQAAVNGQAGYYDLYLQSTAPQCSPIYIQVIGAGSSATTGAVSVQSDGQPTATPVPICQLSDGQPQVTSCQPISQLSDGQIRASSAGVVTQISDGQIRASSAGVVTQISDGQIRASSAAAPVTQISDGQIRASSAAAPVTQISDGQIRASSAAAPITQISDGQIQGPTTTPKTTGTPVVQISDGQIRASASASATSSRSIQAYSGAAMPTAAVRGEAFGIALGALAIGALL